MMEYFILTYVSFSSFQILRVLFLPHLHRDCHNPKCIPVSWAKRNSSCSFSMRKDWLISVLNRGSKGTHKPGTVTLSENFKSLTKKYGFKAGHWTSRKWHSTYSFDKQIPLEQHKNSETESLYKDTHTKESFACHFGIRKFSADHWPLFLHTKIPNTWT